MPNPPVPFPLKVLRGNPGKRPMKPEPQPQQLPDVPDPPPFITGYAADEWWRTAPELHRLGLLTRIDVPALAAYCHAFGQWRMAAESLAKMRANDPIMNGLIIKTKYGDATAVARTRLAAGGFAPPSPGKFDGLFG
jgi:P27 family predicted phage terminase small subunit